MPLNPRAGAHDQASLMLAGYACVSLLATGLIELAGVNATLFMAINRFAAEHVPDGVLSALTMFGEGLWDMALIAPFLLIAPRVNLAGLYAAPLTLVFAQLPKLLLHWPRPAFVFTDHQAHLVDAPRAMNAFPSGHAVVAGMIATVVILGYDPIRKRPWLALPVLSLSLLISWSRIAVGAHWPRDVLVGAALGVAAGYAGIALVQRFNRMTPRTTVTVAIIYVLGAIVLAFTRTPHPLTDLLRDALVALGGLSALAAIAKLQMTRATKRTARTKAESQALTT